LPFAYRVFNAVHQTKVPTGPDHGTCSRATSSANFFQSRLEQTGDAGLTGTEGGARWRAVAQLHGMIEALKAVARRSTFHPLKSLRAQFLSRPVGRPILAAAGFQPAIAA
jgi:hypothetical protein